MAGSVNRAIIIGNVGRDPIVKNKDGSRKYALFSVATSETWRDKNGDRKEETTWHDVSIYSEKLIEVVEKYVKKGSKVYVEGQYQSYKRAKKGMEITAYHLVVKAYGGQLVLLDKRDGDGGGYDARAPRDDDRRSGGSASGKPSGADPALDDEIPF